MESKCPDENAHVQDDVNPHILRMLQGTFSLDKKKNFIYLWAALLFRQEITQVNIVQ